MPPAIEGQGGDARTFWLACRLALMFGLDDADALDVFRVWNARCLPPWTIDELLQKLRAARLYGGTSRLQLTQVEEKQHARTARAR